MLKRSIVTIAIGAFLCACGGCVQSNTYGAKDVSVSSQPPGAAVTLDSKPAGVTPVTVPLERVYSHVVVISMPGYHPVRAKIPPEVVRDSYLGAGVIDLVRASQARPIPDAISVILEPVEPGARPRTVNWVNPARDQHQEGAHEDAPTSSSANP